ncbi:hypothetical protein MVEN_02378100 [Mycena venus]|uniref:DUF6532 domain-containing protein n=1 Tax=Mycena venus TaxID=2733690 RepID=A0A8H6X2P4_9AGAR|nr:hypothetical protein MVEN_02378100 [Mycena venus]
MTDRPRRTTTGRRPGLVDAPKARRTAAEVQEDDNRLAAAAEAQREAAEQTHCSAVGRVAAKEDEMLLEDREARVHAARPDLLTAARTQLSRPVSHDIQNDATMDSDHDFDEPPASTIDTDSDGMVLGTEPESEHDNFAADGDDDRDEDYVQSDGHDDDPQDGHPASDDDGTMDTGLSEAEFQVAFAEFLKARAAKAKKATTPTASKGKGKAGGGRAAPKEKGQLRAEIATSRDTVPAANVPGANASKRKAAALPSAMEPPPVPKRAKAAELGGLKSNWKKAVDIDDRGRGRTSATGSRTSSKSKSSMRGTSSEGGYGGAFADDEPETSLQAAQASKSSGSMSRSGGTAKMGIKLTPVASALGPVTTSRQKKPKVKNEDLPFAPDDYRDKLKRWQTLALAYIVEWAGSTDDAFAAGQSHPGFRAAVELAWSLHFPDIAITPAVYSLAASGIRNWRSEIGKRALVYLAKFFAKREENKGETKQQRAEFVAEELEDMNFVYRDPNNKRGACRSEAILYVYSYHTRITSVIPADERKKPKAALAISTVAMERAYNMWATGSQVSQPVERKGKKPAHRFVTVPWASRAAKYLTIIKKLSDSKWEEINASAQYSDVGGDIVWGDGGDGDDTSEGPDPRLEIQLSSDEEVVVEVIES